MLSSAPDGTTVTVARPMPGGKLIVCARLRSAGRVTLPTGGASTPAHRVVLTTEDAAFAVEGRPPRVTTGDESLVIEFDRPSAVLLWQTRRGEE